jgi:pSer/pThr/pTyr-binding forkhead associated (FHA) protein
MCLTVTDLDGAAVFRWPLAHGDNPIGRDVHERFVRDNLLSGRHATFIAIDRGVWVRDEGARNGVFVRLPRDVPVELVDQDQFILGRVILRFEHRPAPEREGWLQLMVGRDVDSSLFPWPVPLSGATLGRDGADLPLPRCGEVSGLHCEIVCRDRRVMLMDRGSANGTFHRIRGVHPLPPGAQLLMGQWIYTLCEL